MTLSYKKLNERIYYSVISDQCDFNHIMAVLQLPSVDVCLI